MHMVMHHDDAGHTFEIEDSRPLYLMTALLCVLIGMDVVFEYLLGIPNTFYGIRYSLIAAVLGGARVLYTSLELAFEGNIGGDFALAIACIAAILVGEPLVAAEVVFIGMVGESLEAITFGRTKHELRSLLELRPHTAFVLRDGTPVEVHTDDLEVGDRILVKPGARIPADGAVEKGQTSVDQSALTGESLPADKGPGDEVFTGTLNQNGSIEFTATKVGANTSFGQLLQLIEEAHERKAPLEKTADRYARYFLPIVLACAGATYLFSGEVMRSVAVLVVACPCGLILATPAAVLASVARLARVGVVLRGGLALERLARATSLVFDKTGTLTEGKPTLGDVLPISGHDAEEVLWCAATAEQGSEHVLAGVILQAAHRRRLDLRPLDTFEALPGAGVRATALQETLLVGNRRLLEAQGIDIPDELDLRLMELDERGQTALIVVRGSEAIGAVGARDTIRPEADHVLEHLRELGFDDIALVTGDRPAAANVVAQQLGIREVVAEQLPADKATFIEDWRKQGKKVAMIGDGINDAPALAVSDVGLALGGVGTNIAAEAGDIILMRDPLEPLPFAVRISRQTLRVIQQNIIVFAFLVNATAILLSSMGILPPIGAAIYHQIGSFLVLLNGMRLLFFERWEELAVVRWFHTADDMVGELVHWLNPMTLIDWSMRHGRLLLRVGMVAPVLYYLSLGLCVIEVDEIGMHQRFGKVRGELSPGLHVTLPPPFDRVLRVQPAQTRTIEIGYRSAKDADVEALAGLTIEWNSPHREGLLDPRPEEGLMLTGDESLAEVNAAVHYRISDVRTYFFSAADPDAALVSVAEAVLRQLAASIPENELLTTGRAEFERRSLELLRQRCGPKNYDLGIDVIRVVLTDVHPPLDVVRSYHDVGSAMEAREQLINKAESYGESTRLLAASEGQAQQDRASGEGTLMVENAHGSTDAYLARQAAYNSHKDLTRARLFWETVETSLAERRKVLLDPKASGRRQILLGNPSEFGSPGLPFMLGPNQSFGEEIPPGEH